MSKVSSSSFDFIVVGAGAAGLMAAAALAEKGNRVCILEAGPVAGGRIATLKSGFSTIAESGAEFIHPPAPLTLDLLKEAGIEYKPVKGKMINVKNGRWEEEDERDDYWADFIKKLNELDTDMTISNFLHEHFSAPEYEHLRTAVKNFAEGFDLADVYNASILSIKDEWQHDDETQYRITGGYCRLIDYLCRRCKTAGAVIHFNCVVHTINYEHTLVSVSTNSGESFTAAKIIVAVPLGVLQAGNINFIPQLKEHNAALHQLGFGSVIKILLQFKNPFWKNYNDNIGFLLTNEGIPTWWTQSPSQGNVLTGWLGGPQARRKSGNTSDTILKSALLSLSAIFKIPTSTLYDHLSHHQIDCWQNHPFIKGGYSYNTIYSSSAKLTLAEPVNGCIFFAGEAFYDGPSQGTVEAALQSGKETAHKIKTGYQQNQPATMAHK